MIPDIDLAGPAADTVDWLLLHLGGVFDGIGAALETVVGAITSALSFPAIEPSDVEALTACVDHVVEALS